MTRLKPWRLPNRPATGHVEWPKDDGHWYDPRGLWLCLECGYSRKAPPEIRLSQVPRCPHHAELAFLGWKTRLPRRRTKDMKKLLLRARAAAVDVGGYHIVYPHDLKPH